jgi:hypothetical protein
MWERLQRGAGRHPSGTHRSYRLILSLPQHTAQTALAPLSVKVNITCNAMYVYPITDLQ